MASIGFPSPISSLAASPSSAFTPPTFSTSPLNSSEGVLPPTSSQPDQTIETSGASSPSSSSAAPPPTLQVPATLRPSPPVSLPPTSPPPGPPPVISAPPPSVPVPPPPTTPASPPPSTPASPPPTPPLLLPPPSNPATPPQSQSTVPPKQITPPQSSSPPAPVVGSPPSPAPPALSPPPPQALSPAAPSPPINPATPPTPNREPQAKSSPPALATPPPSGSQSDTPPLSSDGPPGPALPSSPPSIPLTTSPPSIALPVPPSDLKPSRSPPLSPLPSRPTEKPTARSTDGVTSNDSSTHKGGISSGGGVAIGIAVGFVMLSLLIMAVWFINKQKRRTKVRYSWSSPAVSSQNSATVFLKPNSHALFYGSVSGSELMYSPSEQGGVSNSKAWFTYEELVHATKGFSEQNLLGEGGFGCVFKGLLSDGREIAVKQLKIGSGQGEREFRAEVEIISRVHHRHLVSLVGYCISEHQRLLVYEYVPNNTLHNHLHVVDKPVMSWGTRVRVAAGSARGIAYLHEDCHPRIIHRDIKSSNILLDNNFEARVADFGLAKLALDSNTHVTTRVMGTFGYMAPEYATSGKLTEKSDVYSFGVVLLELITGRKPVDTSQPIGDESLVEWARPLLTCALENEDFEGLVDPRLENNYDPKEMCRIIEAAAACVRHSAAKRPRMSQVVRVLVSLDELSDLTNGMKPGQSEVFDSAEQSAQIRMFQRMAFGSQDYSTSFFNETRSSWRSREQGDSNVFPHNNRSGAWNV